MTFRPPAQTFGRREVLAVAAVVPFVGVAGCGDVTDADAGRKGVESFENELTRIGYTLGANGTWAIAPRRVSIGARGDQLEAEVRAITVTGTRPVGSVAKALDQGISWRGQVYLTYGSRERFHRDGVPADWSAWSETSSILNVERRGGQWYVQRVR